VIEPVLELRQEPAAAAVLIKEEEIVKPMTRNIVKEEIPQVEELRNILPEDTIAVKETVPEPVASLNIVEPVVEVEQQVKNIIAAPIVKEDSPALIALLIEPEAPLIKPEAPLEEPKAPLAKSEAILEKSEAPLEKSEAPLKIEAPLLMTEILLAQPAIILEKKTEELSGKLETILMPATIKEEKIEAPAPAAIEKELKSIPEIKPVPEIITPTEAKPLSEAAPSVEESDPEIRQDRPSIAQQIQTALQSVPVVGPLISNLQNQPSSASASDEASSVTDESATPARPNLIQQVLQNTQTAWTNAVQALNPPSANVAAEGESDAQRPSPLANAISFVQGSFQNVANGVQSIISRPSTEAPPKDEEKPLKEEGEKPVEEKPTKTDDKVKTVPSEPQAEVEPVVAVKPEEPQKVVEGEKENLVKN